MNPAKIINFTLIQHERKTGPNAGNLNEQERNISGGADDDYLLLISAPVI
ncbi:MAG: hypothetical protein WCK53_08455 [Methanomicrobiales archaeon]